MGAQKSLMAKSSRALGTELWREVVERLDDGVIVFSDRGVVIYANDEAARLLAYAPRDVLELNKDDFLSLCQLDRLEGAQFASALRSEQIPDSPSRRYEVATSGSRLRIAPFTLPLEAATVTVLLLHEIENWRSEVISEHLLSPEMESSISLASSYSQTLIARLESGEARTSELLDLAHIIHSGLNRTLSLRATLARLRATDPRHGSEWEMKPIALPEVIYAAVHEVGQHAARRLPAMQFDLAPDLPPVAASEQHLQSALFALLNGAVARLSQHDHLTISARHRRRYVQVDFTPDTPRVLLQGYQFDVLPLAIVEQVIARHGGRLWLRSRNDRSKTVSLSLPVWTGEPAATHIGSPTAGSLKQHDS